MDALPFLVAVAAVPSSLGLMLIDPIRARVEALFGRRRIHIRGINSAIRGDCWTSNLRTDSRGENYAFRYPGTRIGIVKIYPNGTGYYCGAIEWEFD